jgi:hypothetical protein
MNSYTNALSAGVGCRAPDDDPWHTGCMPAGGLWALYSEQQAFIVTSLVGSVTGFRLASKALHRPPQQAGCQQAGRLTGQGPAALTLASAAPQSASRRLAGATSTPYASALLHCARCPARQAAPGRHVRPRICTSRVTTLTRDDIRAEGHSWDDLPHMRHQFIVGVPGVAAPHAFQHTAAAALRRHVQLLAHVGPRGYHLRRGHHGEGMGCRWVRRWVGEPGERSERDPGV